MSPDPIRERLDAVAQRGVVCAPVDALRAVLDEEHGFCYSFTCVDGDEPWACVRDDIRRVIAGELGVSDE